MKYAVIGLCIVTAVGGYFMLFDRAVISSCQTDLDGDGVAENIILTGKVFSRFGRTISIGSSDRIYSYDMKHLKPWKVQTCDIDGDGKKEISVGVFKTARHHPVEAKRPFLYEWSEGIYPKWLGSRLSRPFRDYVFADIDSDGKDELVSAEFLKEGGMAVNSYNWKGFGFEGAAESERFDDVMYLWGGEEISAEVMMNGSKKKIRLVINEGKLVIDNE